MSNAKFTCLTRAEFDCAGPSCIDNIGFGYKTKFGSDGVFDGVGEEDNSVGLESSYICIRYNVFSPASIAFSKYISGFTTRFSSPQLLYTSQDFRLYFLIVYMSSIGF